MSEKNSAQEILRKQESRLPSEFQLNKLEVDCRKNWDLFYKRNGNRFFKDRHWTTREFEELIGTIPEGSQKKRVLLEAGCGVGNLVIPLLEEKTCPNTFFLACDFSCRAVDILRSHSLYDVSALRAFTCDLTVTGDLQNRVRENLCDKNDSLSDSKTVDIVSLVFVLSSIHPDKFKVVVRNLFEVLAPGGVLVFRDYGLLDMAQLRFKPGSKLTKEIPWYKRQDGTRSYFFDVREVQELFEQAGFDTIGCGLVERRTVNVKEGVDAPRTFVQGKFRKGSRTCLKNME